LRDKQRADVHRHQLGARQLINVDRDILVPEAFAIGDAFRGERGQQASEWTTSDLCVNSSARVQPLVMQLAGRAVGHPGMALMTVTLK
jgi:hypothetical protein